MNFQSGDFIWNTELRIGLYSGSQSETGVSFSVSQGQMKAWVAHERGRISMEVVRKESSLALSMLEGTDKMIDEWQQLTCEPSFKVLVASQVDKC